MPLRLPGPALLLAALLNAVPAVAGVDAGFIDKAGNPCRGFFEYANGGWLRATTIPPDYASWGIDEEIDQRNLRILRRILETAAEHDEAAGTVVRQIGDFYAAAMDEAAIERAGLAPLQPELDEI